MPPKPQPRRVIIDTDPGVDDALAILFALGSSPALQVEGLTIAAGNIKNIRELGANAKLLLRLAGAEGIPVSLGRPAEEEAGVGPCETGAEATEALRLQEPRCHGLDGLGGVSARYGRCEADFTGFHDSSASEFIYETCSRSPGEVSVICIGPLRNLAAALTLHPDLRHKLGEVLIMGGALGLKRGNRTPAAEANFAEDPKAAQTVLTAGIERVVLAGLDVTHQTDVHVLREACRSLGSPLAGFVWDVCEHYIRTYQDDFGESHGPAHDLVPVMYLLRPDLFASTRVRVDVETEGRLTSGMSIADWQGRCGLPANCEVLREVTKREAFAVAFAAAVHRLPLAAAPDAGAPVAKRARP